MTMAVTKGESDYSDRQSPGGSDAIGLKGGMQNRAMIRSMVGEAMTAEPALVEEYDAAAGTVSVSLKNQPEALPLHGVRVAGMGGNWGIVWPIVPATTDRKKATVGIVVFMRTDSTESFGDRQVSTPPSQVLHRGHGAVFIPGVALDADNVPDAVVGKTPLKVEPGDMGFVNRQSGGCLLLKADGGLEVHVAYMRIIKFGKGRSDLKTVARKGEAGGLAATAGTGFMEVTDSDP